MAPLHAVTDYADAAEDEPTRPGDFATPGHLGAGRVVHQLLCPHHSLPWAKILATQLLVAAVLIAMAVRLVLWR
jgi:hypothetical protein